MGLGQGTGGKQLSSSLETTPALGLWQKLGLGGLKPGRGAVSGGACLSLGADRQMLFLPRHFSVLFVSNPSNCLPRLLETNYKLGRYRKAGQVTPQSCLSQSHAFVGAPKPGGAPYQVTLFSWVSEHF